MKRHWTADELTEHWTLHPVDPALLANKSGATRLGFALLLKFFHYEARFPQAKNEIPGAVIVQVAQQLGVPPELYAQYEWTGRTKEYHRAQIREAHGFRAATTADADDLSAWLAPRCCRTSIAATTCCRWSMRAAALRTSNCRPPAALNGSSARPCTPMKRGCSARSMSAWGRRGPRASTRCSHPTARLRTTGPPRGGPSG